VCLQKLFHQLSSEDDNNTTLFIIAAKWIPVQDEQQGVKRSKQWTLGVDDQVRPDETKK
jgi:hypothetical protein